jgi:ribosomal protein S18 acetylase RimI-like enzyme
MPLHLIRSLESDDAPSLFSFYASLSSASLRTFRPLGLQTSLPVCERIVLDNATSPARRFDFVACEQAAIVGWSFIEQLTGDHPNLGIGVADPVQGRGVGTVLLERTLERARQLGLRTVFLMVVQDNLRAIRWYQRHGFVTYGEEFDEGDQLAYFHMRAGS